VSGRRFVNDSAACAPAATATLVATIDYPFVLVCGGDRQRYRPGEFDALAASVATNPHVALVCTTGPMAGHIEHALRRAGFGSIAPTPDIPHAVERALDVPGAAVVFSPGCGTGSLFSDKYARGEVFDDAVTGLLSEGQTVH
jgi:UDP-N-acetylmuramoylalanine-D-glutamate ligase